MASEYFINDQKLEDQVRKLLPSQGGAGAGFDLSASTQIIPIIDLTESAEGSNLRQDLQSSLSHGSVTPFDVLNTATTLVNNTGYWRVFGNSSIITSNPLPTASFGITDGTTLKNLITFDGTIAIASIGYIFQTYDFIVKLNAGDSLVATSVTVYAHLIGNTRQIADINGDLTNPT